MRAIYTERSMRAIYTERSMRAPYDDGVLRTFLCNILRNNKPGPAKSSPVPETVYTGFIACLYHRFEFFGEIKYHGDEDHDSSDDAEDLVDPVLVFFRAAVGAFAGGVFYILKTGG